MLAEVYRILILILKGITLASFFIVTSFMVLFNKEGAKLNKKYTYFLIFNLVVYYIL